MHLLGAPALTAEAEAELPVINRASTPQANVILALEGAGLGALRLRRCAQTPHLPSKYRSIRRVDTYEDAHRALKWGGELWLSPSAYPHPPHHTWKLWQPPDDLDVMPLVGSSFANNPTAAVTSPMDGHVAGEVAERVNAGFNVLGLDGYTMCLSADEVRGLRRKRAHTNGPMYDGY